MKKERKVLIALVLALVAVGLFCYYRYSCLYETTDDAQIDGNIIPVRTRIGGYVREVRFRDNQSVRKGDTLLILETTDLNASVEEARARLVQAEAEIDVNRNTTRSADLASRAADFSAGAAEENIGSAQARLEKARKDLGRVKALYEKGAATAQTYDAAQAVFSAAEADLESVRKQSRAMQARMRSAGSRILIERAQGAIVRGKIDEAKAALAAAEYTLSQAVILAPCDGILSGKKAEPGQLLLAGSAVASLVDGNDVYVTANFKENQLNDIREGDSVRISLDAYKDVRIAGRVESVAGAAGSRFALIPPDNASGNFVKVTQRVPVRIAIRSIENPRHKLILPGLNAFVSVRVK